MRFQNVSRRVTGSLALVALLAACENSQTQTIPAGYAPPEARAGPLISRSLLARFASRVAHPAWMRFAGGVDPEAKGAKAGVYVSQFYSGQINGYKLNNKQNGAAVCQVPGVQDVNGIAVDQTGKIYVPQEIPSHSGGMYGEITVYAQNCGKLLKTLSSNDPLLNAAIDGNTVYGMDNVGASPTLVSVYADGATSPTSYLKGPTNPSGHSTINGYAVAVDSQHDVFVSVYAPDSDWNSEIIEFPEGQMPAVELTATLWLSADFPAGVLVDKQSNLIVVNPVNNSSIAIYTPPYTSPSTYSFALRGGASYCALNHPETRLYCTDYQYGSADVYKYPSGLYLYSFTNGLDWNDVPEGMAVSPAAPL
jgi:hypothetical protein